MTAIPKAVARHCILRRVLQRKHAHFRLRAAHDGPLMVLLVVEQARQADCPRIALQVPLEVSITYQFVQVQGVERQKCFFNTLIKPYPLIPEFIKTLQAGFGLEAGESRIVSLQAGHPDFIAGEHVLKCPMDVPNQSIII